MPRDASPTRARLLREATRIFAERGVYQATLREITEAAGQRNASALAYHFGSREGVLWAILDLHNGPIDALRATMLPGAVGLTATRDLFAALLIPYFSELATAEGRDYLRIVAQLTDLFPAWRDGPLSPPALRQILATLEQRAQGATPAVRRERVLQIVMLLTAAMADRARVATAGGHHHMPDREFLANLADVMTGILEAQCGPTINASYPAARAV